MFTVVLTSARSRRLLERWRELFTPFEERKDIAFCTWNPGPLPRTIEEAVPELPNAIKGKKEWRALVVATGAEATVESPESLRINPFDFAAGQTTAPDGGIDHSPWPLVRLTHMLLGYPELGPKGFEADPSFRDTGTDERVHQSELLSGLSGEARYAAELDFKSRAILGHDPRIEYRPIPHAPQDVVAHSALTSHYEPQQTLPSEVILVAPRRRPGAPTGGSLHEDWNASEVRELSRFVERNNYPPSCRFLAFDLRPQTHVEFDLEEMRFVLSLLTLSINDLPASGLQAERLYRLNTVFDFATLANMLNEHLGQLVEMRHHIDGRLRVHEPRVSSPTTEVLPRITVTVNFESLNGEKLQVPLTEYGLAADRPVEGQDRWRDSVSEVRAQGAHFVRQPARALRQSVLEARERHNATKESAQPMSDIEIEELERELADRSDQLVRQASGSIADPARLEALIAEQDRHITRAMGERMRSATITTAIAVVMAAWLAALLPYLAALLFDGGANLAEGFLVSTLLIGIVLASAFVTLVIMRRQILALLRQFNQSLRNYVGGVTQGAARYGSFLSDLVTYASGRQRLMAERRRAAQSRLERTQLRLLRDRIEERIAAEKSIVRSIDRPIQIEQGSHVVSDLEEFGLARAEKALLWSPGRTHCQFNRSGDTVAAPYPFVTRLTVEDLVIHEPGLAPSSDQTPSSATSHTTDVDGT